MVDFGQYVAGPLLAMMLADHGADVIRVDPPDGERWSSPANAVLQRGKRRIALDLKDEKDARTAQTLAASADIVIEGFRPGVMAKFGLGQDTLRAANLRLIYCSLPGFAADDPRAGLAGWEGVVGAAAGVYSPTVPERLQGITEPCFNALTVCSNFAALIAANCVIAALIARERTGLGQHIEIPLFDAAFEAIGAQAQALDFQFPPAPIFHKCGSKPYLCADGRWIFIVIFTPRHTRWLVQGLLDEEDRAAGLDDHFRLVADPELSARLDQRLTELFMTRPSDHWDEVINGLGVTCTIIRTTADFLREDEQARAAGAAIELQDSELGPTLQGGYATRMSSTRPQAQGPRRGHDADRAEILADLDQLPQTPRREPRQFHGAGALAGVKVVDVSQVFAGPTAGRILAEMGAEVIKINPPQGLNIGHLHTNSGKLTGLIDLADPEGQRVLWRHLESADVYIHNLAGDAAQRLAIDADRVLAAFPNLITGAMTAYTNAGTRAGFRGWEPVGWAATGMMLRAGDGVPRFAGFNLCDYGSGHLLAFGVLVGLFHRERTGKGQSVESSLLQAGVYQQMPYMIDYQGRTWDEPAGPAARGWSDHDRLFEAADRWLYVAAPDLERLCQAIGVSERSVEELERVMRQRPAADWLERLRQSGIAAHDVRTVQENALDENVRARGLVVTRDHPGLGEVRLTGPGRRMSRTPVKLAAPAPAPGADTRKILQLVGAEESYGMLAARGAAADQIDPHENIVHL